MKEERYVWQLPLTYGRLPPLEASPGPFRCSLGSPSPSSLPCIVGWSFWQLGSDEAAKANEVLKLASAAVLATAVAIGAWYALAFLSLPSDV